ncbi:MAG TPA: non-homologous end-joining DNA ligase [Lacunisphaera sp.]|nr:non-homologous end-joining DNA ligase [Lacunisphaera sp.]
MAKQAKVPQVKFSNLDKIFFPKAGFTKGEMIKYYVDVAPYLLPHLHNRPVTLIRFPDGITGERFYEKNAPRFAPDWIKTARVPRRRESGDINYILINDAATLAWCANLAALELHPFLHRAGRLDEPTHLAFDFDPGEGADLVDCARVALHVKAILDGLKLEAFPKVSGSKGLQLYVPLNRKATYAATGSFAKAMAELLEREHPDLVVSRMDKKLRRGKVMIDWSQNSPSKTTVAVYSMRGKREEPFISMPVTWEELRKLVRTRKTSALFFSPAAALKRLKQKGDLFAPVLTLKQSLPKAFGGMAAPADPLQRYEEKRDFTRTKEPAPVKVKTRRTGKAARFVIQKHEASHLHYDFRLEMDGTLKSWAVPKGLATESGVKRSAFEVEDHPLAYMKFEGTIPKGQYGGGTVMVWDIGTYELLGGSHREGNLKLRLKGRKLKGEWHLFRIRSEDEKKPVWLIAKSGKAAKPIGPRQDDSSVLTRRSMARIARDNDAQWQSKH